MYSMEIVIFRLIQLVLVVLLLGEAFFLYHGVSSRDLLLTELSVLLILAAAVALLVVEKFIREEYELLREKRDIIASAEDLLRRTPKGKSKE